MAEVTWDDVKVIARSALSLHNLDGIYHDRLEFEIKEIEKQGASSYWTGLVIDECKFANNPNSLVLPWLLGMTDDDPITNRNEPVVVSSSYQNVLRVIEEFGKLPSDMIRDSDNPDIDIDCLPQARDPIKEYATRKYSVGIDDDYGSVCSVGTWMTYLFRSALKDVAKAMGACDMAVVDLVTKELPDEVDELKDNGESPCKGCKRVHNEVKCPVCGSPDTESPTIGKLLVEQPLLKKFNDEYPEVVDNAVRLVGRVRALGKHAGALIIADRPLFGNIPLAFDSNSNQWKSYWTEGRNTQLSKFGYVKWDVLGLKNLLYIYEASRMIQQNHGISFGERSEVDFEFEPGKKIKVPSMSGWDYSDPDLRHGGYYYDRNGDKVIMDLDDPVIMKMASDGKTDAVFQFDTDLAKRILSNGVYSFDDLLIFNAMGHPGPMAMIPDYVERRGDPNGPWRHEVPPQILKILKSTFGTIVFQEQLQAMWQEIAGFTAPEAQEGRKAVAKKWKDKLKPIERKWLSGSAPLIGEEQAKTWWDKQVSFGRYAFNKSHAVSYCLVAYHCLWLKAFFPNEWWASVMSYCNAQKLVRYMNVARSEGVIFKPMDVDDLSLNFIAVPDVPRLRHTDPPNGTVAPGLICLKGIGASVASKFTDDSLDNLNELLSVQDELTGESTGGLTAVDDVTLAELGEAQEMLEESIECAKKSGPIESMVDFVSRKGKQKLLLERLIKLGSFSHLPGHENRKALWAYYQYLYCSGTDVTKLKAEIKDKIKKYYDRYSDKSIAEEIARQSAEFKALYPKRKVPNKILNYKPKIEVTLDTIVEIMDKEGGRDYTLAEILKFEETFLGYHLHSPLDLYVTKGDRNIEQAKLHGEVEAVIEDIHHTKTRNLTPMCRVTLSDGINNGVLMIWSDDLNKIDRRLLRNGRGIRAKVSWDQQRKNFTLQRGTQIITLQLKEPS